MLMYCTRVLIDTRPLYIPTWCTRISIILTWRLGAGIGSHSKSLSATTRPVLTEIHAALRELIVSPRLGA
jgi:hypothetical protein